MGKTRETTRRRSAKKKTSSRANSSKRGKTHEREYTDGKESGAGSSRSDAATISPEEYEEKRAVPMDDTNESTVWTRSRVQKERAAAERYFRLVQAGGDAEPTFESGQALIDAALGNDTTAFEDSQSTRVVYMEEAPTQAEVRHDAEEVGAGNEREGNADTQSAAAAPEQENELLAEATHQDGADAPPRTPVNMEVMVACLQALHDVIRQLQPRGHTVHRPLRRRDEDNDENQERGERLEQHRQELRRDQDEPGRGGEPRRQRSPERRRRSRSRPAAPLRQRDERPRRTQPGGGGPPSSSSSDESDDPRRRGHDRRRVSRSSSEDSSSSESDGRERPQRQHIRRGRREQRGRRQRREQRESQERHERRRERHREPARAHHRGNVKDLELPTFTPAAGASVSTWTDRIDLALQGARESGRGEWSNHALYFILGNKLMGEAASWWVDFNRRLADTERTWTHLKQALMRRYGPKEDISLVEYRVNTRARGNAESHADYAAALQKAAGRSRVSERVLMAQFYRGMDKTTRQLVKQQEPENLEEAVIRATEIDDPMENLVSIGQAAGQTQATVAGFEAAPTDAPTARTVTLPGVGSVYVPMSGAVDGIKNYAAVDPDGLVLYTNPKGAWNIITGNYELPAGRKWNSRYWAEATGQKHAKTAKKCDTKHKERKPRARREAESSDDDDRDARPRKSSKYGRVEETSDEEEDVKPRKSKPKRAVDSSDDEREAKPQRKLKTAVRQVLAEEKKRQEPTKSATSVTRCYICGQDGHSAMHYTTGPKCYACNKYGHLARDCTDVGTKAKNDGYLAQREAHRDGKRGQDVVGGVGRPRIARYPRQVVKVGVRNYVELPVDTAAESCVTMSRNENDETMTNENEETMTNESEEMMMNETIDEKRETKSDDNLLKNALLKEACEEDVGRAMLYVATSRPTMAAVRFMRAQREGEERERRVIQGAQGASMGGTGGGATTHCNSSEVTGNNAVNSQCPTTTWVAATVPVEETTKADGSTVEAVARGKQTASKPRETENREASDDQDVVGECSDAANTDQLNGTGADIKVQREERKRTRKAAKRLKIKARFVRQRREAQEGEAGQECIAAALRAKRRDDAQEALKELQARRQRRQLDGGSSN